MESNIPKIQPLYNYVGVKMEKTQNETIQLGNISIFKDTSFRPYAEENCVQKAVVMSLPRMTCPEGAFERKIDIEIGDIVYVNHTTIDKKQDDGTYKVIYENIYCKVRSGFIHMQQGWNLVQEIKKDTEHKGLTLVHKDDRKDMFGTIIHIDESMMAQGVEQYDTVVFKPNRMYAIYIENKLMYCIRTKDICLLVKKM
jgi:co-chaperonin GroES (HSP10)